MHTLWWMGPRRDAAKGPEGGGGDPPAKDDDALVKRIRDAVLADLRPLLDAKDPRKDKDTGKGDPPNPDPGKDGKDSAKGRESELERRLANLAKELEDERRARKKSEEDAERNDRHGQIRAQLGGIPFVSDSARETAFALFKDAVRRSESGSLTGPDGEALGEFLKKVIETQHDYLLKPKEVGGAGAGGGRRSAGPAITLDDIRVGMTAEQENAAIEAIRQAYRK